MFGGAHAAEHLVVVLTNEQRGFTVLVARLQGDPKRPVFVTQARKLVEPELHFDASEVGLMITKNAATLLKECADFFAP